MRLLDPREGEEARRRRDSSTISSIGNGDNDNDNGNTPAAAAAADNPVPAGPPQQRDQRLTFLELHTPSMWPTARDRDGCPAGPQQYSPHITRHRPPPQRHTTTEISHDVARPPLSETATLIADDAASTSPPALAPGSVHQHGAVSAWCAPGRRAAPPVPFSSFMQEAVFFPETQ
jgi:hypothetical protein